jgi:enoyl-CoA hydratase/carnithine racemase
MKMYDRVSYHTKQGIATVTIENEEFLNCLAPSVRSGLLAVMDEVELTFP